MENVFRLMIEKLIEIGFYEFLIFILGLGMFYAVMKRSKFFNELRFLPEVLSLVIAFLIFGFPVLLNFSYVLPITKMFTQFFLFILIFFIGFMLASFFYPDLPTFLAGHFNTRSLLSISIVIAIAGAIVSGSFQVIFASPPDEGGEPRVDSNLVTLTSGIVVFVILIIVAGAISLQS